MTNVLGVSRVRYLQEMVTTTEQKILVNLHTVEAHRVENPSPVYDTIMEYAVENCSVVIPIRNPIDNAVSCLSRGHETLDYCISNWEVMFQRYPRFKNVFWIDVWAPVRNRRNMMLKLNEFLGVDPIDQQSFDEYIKYWRKANCVKDDVKQLARRRLPFHDLSQLQFAVDWYNEKKAELDKLYAPADGYGPVASNHRKVSSSLTGGAN